MKRTITIINESQLKNIIKESLNEETIQQYEDMLAKAYAYKDAILKNGPDFAPKFNRNNARRFFWATFYEILDDKEKEEYKEMFNLYNRQKRKNMSAEEKIAWRRRHNELGKAAYKRRIENMTEDELEKLRMKQREATKNSRVKRLSNMSEEEKDVLKSKKNEYERKYIENKKQNMTPEELLAWKKKRRESALRAYHKRQNSMTPEEKEAARKKRNERLKNKRNNKQ